MTESVLKVKEKLGLIEKEAESVATSSRGGVASRGGVDSRHPGLRLNAEGIKVIQDENAELNKQVCMLCGHVTVM